MGGVVPRVTAVAEIYGCSVGEDSEFMPGWTLLRWQAGAQFASSV